jgi:hypothetical protein
MRHHWGVLGLRLLDRSEGGQATRDRLEMMSAGLALAPPQLDSLLAPLPFLVCTGTPEALDLVSRAALLAGAALLTVGYQLQHYFLSKADEEFPLIEFSSAFRLPALGLEVGWLLLSAGALVYERSWAAWVMAGLLGALLLLRQRLTAPDLWAGLVLAGVGYIGLQ